jgi:hypothetical protein
MFTSALKKDPKCIEALFALVSVLNSEKKWNESIQMYVVFIYQSSMYKLVLL